jgi:two-component system, chemotaxis family, sensor kinase CheA
MNEFIEQFLLESRELVELATSELLALEQGARGKDHVDSVFRAFHTLKGAAGIVDFSAMGRALHAAEEVLSDTRGGARPVSPELVNQCLACLDQVTRWLNEMQTAGTVPGNADIAADEIVRSFASGPAAATKGALPRDDAGLPATGQWFEQLCRDHGELLPQSLTAFCYQPDSDAFFRGEDPLALVAQLPDLVVVALDLQGSPVLENLDPFSSAMRILGLTKASPDKLTTAFAVVAGQVEIVELKDRGNGRISPQARSVLEAQVLMLEVTGIEGKAGRLSAAGTVAANVLRYAGLATEASDLGAVAARSVADGDATKLISEIRAQLGKPLPSDLVEATDRVVQASAARVLRVDISRVDALVNLTGELTVVKNAFGHIATSVQDGLDQKSLVVNLREQQALLDRLIGQLQRAVLRIRVLPLRQVFQRFPRLVREISADLGKTVKFVMEGDDTEADAVIVDSLFEPLLHMLRNAIDHGIETSERRSVLGKTQLATITFRARRQLESVIVEVEDDGRGIDTDRVREVAAQRNILASDALAKLDDEGVVALIFAPGFSTTSEVTGISGRGVGMDSVKAAVERLGGGVAIHSRSGHGTIIRLTLPFTVMMTRVMTVETAGQVFGFPLDTVVETAAVSRDHLIAVGQGRAVVLRDRTVPLVDLAESLGLARSERASGEVKVVVTSAAGLLGGVEVERLGERMDVMLKPMGGLLKNMRGIAGTTLLGDGRVLIVLDVQELFQ